MKKNVFKRALSMAMAVLMVLSCWVWFEPAQVMADAAASTLKNHYLFAYFTGTSKEGQTIHLAVSKDGYTYTALRGNDPVIIPSKGVGCVRDPYIWYNEQDNYYYILATDLDFTDGGGDYSNNSQSFIIWRSKDLVNWYDETMIDVNKMAHLIGDTRNMSAVWAPQVLWDGSAYVVYFTLACNATSWFDIVYLKTTDLLDPNAYYEFDYILGNGTGNGVDNGYGVIDADIIHNPGDGKYYLFYKTECNGHEMGSTATGTSLKTIHYYVGDTPTGPFRNPGDTKWSNAGFSVFPNYNVSLEGCNSFFDNDGNLIMYADEFEHKNALGEAEAYFHIAKSNGNDFTSWSYPDVSQHNINSLSPRHGSVVKITENEYNRLLENSYAISSSSFPASETLEDHLVARYFTTNDASYNAVVGGANLDVVSSNVSMTQTATGSWVADFNTGYATIDLEKLFLEGLNFQDGFTITFKGKIPTDAQNNVRFFEIADIPGKRTGVEHYAHFSPKAEGNGVYMGTYNGPAVVRKGLDVNTNDWGSDLNGIDRNDNKWHEYLISFANGNYIVYIDGQVCVMRNRFNTAAMLDDSWYKAIGASTLYIGRSGFRSEYGSVYNDPDLIGSIRDFCIYDTSMSYYDLQSMDSQMKGQLEYIDGVNYTGITSVVPTFQNTDANRMNSLPNKNQHFSNILYTSNTVRNFDGNNMSQDSATWTKLTCGDAWVGLYYPETTVLLLDGVNDAIMPVSFGYYCSNNRPNKGFYNVYPTAGPGSTADLGELEISQNWGGWYNNGDYYNCIVTHEDGYIGRNSTTTSWSDFGTSKTNYDAHWGAPLKVNAEKIDFGDSYYKKFNLTWQINGNNGQNGNERPGHSANLTSDNDIYVIDFRPILELRSQMTAAEYNRIMNGAYCQTLKEKYADAVFSIQTLDPRSYDFTKNAEVGTKALARAIKDAMDNYNGVIEIIKAQDATGVYGHETEILPARDATCEYNGLTQGEICRLCGEVIVPQKTLATVPHTFADVTDGGVKYKKCTVCGVMIEYQASGVRYANFFSFNAWASSASAQVFSGNISIDNKNGTIKIVNQSNSEIYTRGHYDGQDLVSTRDFGNYCIPVTGGVTYVVEATSLPSSTSHGEVFIFQYDKNGLVYKTIPTVLGLNPGQTAHNEFTVDSNAAYIELRFDCNDAGKTITYSQIGIYEKEEFDKFGATTADARLGFYPGNDIELCYPNPAPGYIFDGWYTVDGRLIENVNQLNNPTTIVYGKWLTAGYDVVYDSIFSFSEWAKSSCNQLWYGDQKDANGNVTRLVSHDGVFADTENGTITLYNDEDTNYFARTNYWKDTQNVHQMNITPDTEYILEYTVTSEDGGKPSVCLYITGGTAQYPETGAATRYSTGTHYYRFNPGNNTKLTLRFDNVQNGSTVTFSNIAIYKADFEEAARNIENREYRRYYPTKMGIGDVFEYTPVRPGFTFDTWKADTNDDMVGDFNMKGFDDTFLVEKNWHLFSTWTENSYTIQYNANGGSGSVKGQTQKYTANVELASSGFTRTGYTLKGWSTIQSATTAQYQLGQSVSRLNGDPNGTVTLYAVWVKNEPVNVTFDNLIDFKAWNKVSGNGTVTDITDTGMSITCNAGAGEATSSSPYFKVEPGKQYKIDIDITGSAWDVYIFFCDANGNWIDFADGPSNRYSNNGGGSKTQIFTAPDKESVVKAQIRLDANGANTKVNFNDIRVYEYNGYETSVSPANKVVTSGIALGTIPTPTRSGYAFMGWYSGSKEYTANSVVDTNSTLYLTSEWLDMNTVYVLDFAVKAVLNPLDNDEFNKYYSSYKITGISNSMNAAASTTVAGQFGTFALNGNSITYTATSVMKSADVVYYHVDCNGYKFTSSVTVYPANVVYYEDDVQNAVVYTNGKASQGNTGTWSTTGSSKLGNVTTDLSDKVYGYDNAYNNTDNFSMNAAHIVSVSKYNNPQAKYNGVAKDAGSWPVAEFTFAGTGFDIVSLISKDTGAIQVVVTNDKGTKVADWIVDTYYGYTLQNGEWVVDASAKTTLYQIPVIGRTDLDYGSYTVKIIPTYTSRLDHQGDGAYDFYLDAIRVYNPMGDDADAATVYAADGEYVAAHETIRDMLISPDENGASGVSVGAVYINPGITAGTFEQYSKVGPKNEVYLANGQSVAFNMTVSGAIPSAVQVSAHAVDANAAEMRIASGDSYSKSFSISHKTTLYYEVPFTSPDYWTENPDGTFTTKNPIVITNNGTGILALCNIKVTSDAAMPAPVMFRMTRDEFAVAAASAEEVSGLTPDDGALFVPGDLSPETDKDVAEKGDEVLVTINTSAEVYALTVNGVNAVLVSTNDDGSKTWNYTYTAESRGEQTFTLVAYDIHGFASEETTVTVDVQSKIEIFFNKLSHFFSMIIEFFNDLMA